MFGFLIKKTFFDMWDNLFRIVALNLGFLICFALLIYLPLLFQNNLILSYLSIFFSLLIVFIYMGVASAVVKDISDYQNPEFKDIFNYLKATLSSSLFFALISIIFFFLIYIAFPFYSNLKNILGPLAFSLLFWFSIIWILASQYFYPVQSRLDRSIPKVLKKMFLLLLDNTIFSIALFTGTLIVLALSAFTAFLLPGIASILLWLNEALKLRLYKYDYLEEHPDTKKNQIPWDVLLIEDREKIGKRTLKGMIFPWKE